MQRDQRFPSPLAANVFDKPITDVVYPLRREIFLPPRNGGLPMTASKPPRSTITSGASITQWSGCQRS